MNGPGVDQQKYSIKIIYKLVLSQKFVSKTVIWCSFPQRKFFYIAVMSTGQTTKSTIEYGPDQYQPQVLTSEAVMDSSPRRHGKITLCPFKNTEPALSKTPCKEEKLVFGAPLFRPSLINLP